MQIRTYSKQVTKSPPSVADNKDEDEDEEPRSLRPRRAHTQKVLEDVRCYSLAINANVYIHECAFVSYTH